MKSRVRFTRLAKLGAKKDETANFFFRSPESLSVVKSCRENLPLIKNNEFLDLFFLFDYIFFCL